MTTVLEEGRQRYEFSANWDVEKYDNVGIHRKLCSCLSDVKGVDLVGQVSDSTYLIEIKDFRGYRIQNKSRLSTGDLAKEIAQKVLHSLPGLAAHSRSGTDSPIAKAGGKVPKKSVRLFVVLHVEDDIAINLMAWKQQLDIQARMIEKYLAWLPCKVVVTSRAAGLKIPEVSVTNLPSP